MYMCVCVYIHIYVCMCICIYGKFEILRQHCFCSGKPQCSLSWSSTDGIGPTRIIKGYQLCTKFTDLNVTHT